MPLVIFCFCFMALPIFSHCFLGYWLLSSDFSTWRQHSDLGKNQCLIVYSCSPGIHVLMTGKQKLYLSNDLCNKSEAKNSSVWPPVHNSYWKLSWNGMDKDGKSIRQWSRREASVLFILWAAADILKKKMEISEDN